jgi:N-acetylneuraminic acid mutarotase
LRRSRGKIHAVGGRDVNRVTVANHEVYDPATNDWSDRAPLPRARDHLFIATLNDRIHVIGGRYVSPAEKSGFHDVYDPATNSWRQAEPLLTPRSGGAGLVYKDRILVIGGECNNGRPFVENEAYDPRTDRWTILAPMPSGRHGIQAATDGQSVFIPGGAPACATAASDTLLTFTLP